MLYSPFPSPSFSYYISVIHSIEKTTFFGMKSFCGIMYGFYQGCSGQHVGVGYIMSWAAIGCLSKQRPSLWAACSFLLVNVKPWWFLPLLLHKLYGPFLIPNKNAILYQLGHWHIGPQKRQFLLWNQISHKTLELGCQVQWSSTLSSTWSLKSQMKISKDGE